MTEVLVIFGVAVFCVLAFPPVIGLLTSYYEYWEKRIRLRDRFKL